MYKIIIVDDEYIIRQGLKVIVDWEACGFKIIDEAKDGNEALEKIKEKVPDLILLDIKMPVYDGVTLLRILRDQGYKGRVIFITGFSQIEFAKKAIALGADAYLTKPIDEVELYQFLIEIKKKLDQEALINNELTLYKVLEEKQRYRRCLLGQKIISIDSKLGSDKYTVAEIQLEEVNDASYDFFDNYQIKKPQIMCLLVDNNWVLIFINESKSIIKVTLNDLVAEIKHHLKSNYFISVGNEVDGNLNIHKSYLEAKLIGQHFHFENKSKIVYFDEKNFDIPNHFSIDNDLLYQYIEVNNLVGIDRFFTNLENEIRVRIMDFNKTKLLIANSFLEIYDRANYNYATEAVPLLNKIDVSETLLSQKKLSITLQLFKDHILTIVKTIHDGSKSSNMKRLLDYVTTNYDKDLKLERLSEIFSYNSSYLGTLFKQTTGMNFNTYLDSIRIEEAKKLILTNRLKIYEIAHLVGYSDVDYFHSKFKKYVNMSPKQFQQQNRS